MYAEATLHGFALVASAGSVWNEEIQRETAKDSNSMHTPLAEMCRRFKSPVFMNVMSRDGEGTTLVWTLNPTMTNKLLLFCVKTKKIFC